MYSGINAHSQDSINVDMVKLLNIEQDIVNLEDRIKSSIKINNPDIANIQGLQQFHVFLLHADNGDITEDKFSDKSFIYHLNCDYFNLSPKAKKIKSDNKPSLLYRISPDLYYKRASKKWKKYVTTLTFITDSAGNLIATGDARFVTPFFYNGSQELPYMKLAKMFFNKEIDFAFMWEVLGYYFCLKNNDLFVIEDHKEGLKIYGWSEFLNCCFDDWRHQERRSKICPPDIFGHPDTHAMFPGGFDQLPIFLKENMQYPAECQKDSVQGRVTVRFIIDETGKIICPYISKSLHPAADKEVLRVIELMPKWHPASNAGVPCKSCFNLPVTFSKR